MALLITDDCTGCGACEPVCPNNAIYETDGLFAIEPDKCTECVGYHDEPQCVSRCPVDCIVPDPARRESRDELLQKFNRMNGGSD